MTFYLNGEYHHGVFAIGRNHADCLRLAGILYASYFPRRLTIGSSTGSAGRCLPYTT